MAIDEWAFVQRRGSERLIGILLALSAAGPAAGQATDLVATVADGKPWILTQADGQTGQATLAADGTGTMQIGGMSASPTWRRAENGQLCVKPAFIAPERCATLRREGAAIVGTADGVEQYRLTRP
jgi:hypothetical protein